MRRDNPDGNAKDLYAALELAGYSCRRIAAKDKEAGLPDSIVARRGDIKQRTHLLEVKRLGRHLSEAQIKFAMNWPGCVHVATNSWEAEQLFKECEERRR